MIKPKKCKPVKITDSEGKFLFCVKSSCTKKLPDISVTDSDGSVRRVKAQTDVMCLPPVPCPPTIITFKNSIGTTIGSTSVTACDADRSEGIPDGALTITDNNDQVIGTQTVPSGGSGGIKASVKDSDGVVIPLDSSSFVGGNLDLVLPNETYNIYVDGILNTAFTAQAMEDLTINITA